MINMMTIENSALHLYITSQLYNTGFIAAKTVSFSLTKITTSYEASFDQERPKHYSRVQITRQSQYFGKWKATFKIRQMEDVLIIF